MTAKEPLALEDRVLDREAIGRICVSLIASEQQHLLREGRIGHHQLIGARLLAAGHPPPDDLLIDEDTLGLDSLLMLSLVTRVAGVFHLSDTNTEDYLLVRRRLGEWVDLIDHHHTLMGRNARFTFWTSGSIAGPKSVTHCAAALLSEAEAIAKILMEQPPKVRRVLSCVPPHHIYGFLWSCLLPSRLGLEAKQLANLSASSIVRHACSGDLMVGTPFIWEQFAELDYQLPGDVVGVTSGAPSTAETWRCASALGPARILDIYGSTETGGIGWRESRDGTFRTLPDIACLPDMLSRLGNRLDLQDEIDWEKDGSFTILGRKDEILQVAGSNVSPAAVREILLRNPRVRDAAVRLDGRRLKAMIAAAEGADEAELEIELRASAARHLPAPARPDRFLFAPQLPRTAVGKMADW
ncbi:4-coumarate--CoA ligase [Cereibacter sphaeroides]|uniref:4-coumarate--CoA ligase n=1 Tax=Cereibacter sphaeroides TaxID=1063 RepID=UPI000191C8FE|nr:4-coumarate--CoA ligase [Cereibacter sphaeroides]ACM02993.1 4-coumarate--CoA ligase [Cereibacter sphaeroides KD131]EKX56860.1 4-coumarate--CoA ligase (4CL) (4-coumaroyl-CoA synthase) [Rhodobacter sp. AKP1]RHZ92859.1 4-coumarate--CoA ligase [Cereibacter sphaeroides]